MPPVTVKVLGGFSMVATSPVRFATHKTESLFVYLLLSGQAVSRDRLAGIFWPNATEERARRNLSTALWRLKSVTQSIPEIWIDVSGDSVRLRCETVEIDAVRFRSLVESLPGLDGHSRTTTMAEAERLYNGDFLDGFPDEWCEDERRYLRTLYGRLLRQLVETSKTSGEFVQGIRYARRLVEIDPFDEESHRELMLLYHLSGDRGAAMAQFEATKRILQEELGTQPSPASVELYQYIRSRSEWEANRVLKSADWKKAANSSDVPIVGRDEHLASLMRAVDRAARGLGTAVVLSGEAGVGKTRLVESVALEAGLRGFDILQGRCFDLLDQPPYHVFVQALWPRISSADKPGGGASSPLAALLHALAPEASLDYRHAALSSRTQFFDSAIVNEALLSLLGRSHSGRPTLLILEDIHRIDKASTALLLTLLERLPKANLCVLLTIRSGENATAQMQSLLTANGASEIRVEGLTEQEIGKLIQVTLRSRHTPPGLQRFMWERSNGVPLFALESLKLLLENGFLKKDPLGSWSMDKHALDLRMIVPSRVQEIIRQRIARLPSNARKLLCAAAALGTEVDFNQLRELVGSSEEPFIEHTNNLVEAQLLLETKEGFRFPHESTRLVALSMEKRAALKAFHRKAAEIIVQSAPGRTEDLAWHYEEAGVPIQALRYAEASGDKATAVYANGDAAAWYSRALQLLDVVKSSDPGERETQLRRAALILKRQGVLDLIGDRRGQSADLDAILSIAERLSDHKLLAEALHLRANLLMRTNANEAALTTIRKATQLFRAAKDLRAEARVYETAGSVYNNLRRYDLASAEFRRALRLFRRLGDRAGQARSFLHLGTLLGFQSREVFAIRYLDRADVLLHEIGDHRSRAMAKITKGILYRYLGRLKLSESHMASGVGILTQIGDRVGVARGMIHLAFTHAVMGKHRDAIHECERALRIAKQAKDVRAQILILNNSAYGVYRLVGSFARAERYITKAMTLVAEAASTESVAPYTDTMAAISLDREDLHEALKWALRSEELHKPFRLKSWIGLETDYRLGSVYLELGRYSRAMRYLWRARKQYPRGQELAYETLATAALAKLHLIRGDIATALRFARAVSDLLRKIEGVEQIQKVYWILYLVFGSAGLHGAARRVLRQAYASVIQQASTLKGRFRRVFLSNVRVNREILEEVGRNPESFLVRGMNFPVPKAPPEVHSTKSHPPGNEKSSQAGSVLGSATKQDGIKQRRHVIAGLLEQGTLTQDQLAATLGISPRTVRNDLAALRSQGLLQKPTQP